MMAECTESGVVSSGRIRKPNPRFDEFQLGGTSKRRAKKGVQTSSSTENLSGSADVTVATGDDNLDYQLASEVANTMDTSEAEDGDLPPPPSDSKHVDVKKFATPVSMDNLYDDPKDYWYEPHPNNIKATLTKPGNVARKVWDLFKKMSKDHPYHKDPRVSNASYIYELENLN